MPSSGMIVLASIKHGNEDVLRQRLNAIGNDINSRRMLTPRAHIEFPASRTTHFARMAVCDDPDRGPGRKRLLMATDFDGDFETHARELLDLTTDPDALFGCCEGYDAAQPFAEFLRARMIQPSVHYIALPGQTLEYIRASANVRARAEEWLHTPQARALAESVGQIEAPTVWAVAAQAAQTLVGVAERTALDATKAALTGLDVLGIMARHGPFETLDAARRINATIGRVWWIQLFNLLTLNAAPPPPHTYSTAPVDRLSDCAPAEDGDEVVSRGAWLGAPTEDLVSQNQLTLITQVRPGMLARLESVLSVIDLFARRLSAQGELVGISTIHTVRWALLDGGKRFLMLSNYDGAWEAYIDEFAELILSGLNALWDTSLGFPEAGAQDVAALKHFLRCHQVPSNVFYSAYPATTLININDNLKLKQHLQRQLAGLRENG